MIITIQGIVIVDSVGGGELEIHNTFGEGESY